MTCNHDIENARRVGRAKYICPKCGSDITMHVVFMMEAMEAENDDR
jgi:hypothetical protein